MRPFISLCLPVSMKDSCPSGASCFSSLFNLQGTNRSQSAELQYNTFAILCQVLFSFLSKLFRTVIQSPTHANLFSLAHFRAFVNTFFQLLFGSRRFRCPVSPLARRSVNIANHSLVVNTFLQLFFAFFVTVLSTTKCGAFTKR